MHMPSLRKYAVPIAILIFSILSFGLLLPFLGFYWDDWPMIWFSYTQGPLGFPEVFSGDRPFLSLIYILTTSIFKTSPHAWQLLGLFSRILTSIAFWWAFSQMWPEQREKLGWAAILFAPTLVGGIYGMNFDLMPELHWAFGYPMALALMLASSVTLFTVFKTKGWL